MSKKNSHSRPSASLFTQPDNLLARFLVGGDFKGTHNHTTSKTSDDSLSKTSAVYLSAFRQAYTPLIHALLSGNSLGE